jgi:hypothetical protein
LINGSALVVLQVMSARNEDNSLFEGGGMGTLKSRTTGRRMRAEEAYEAMLASGDRDRVSSMVSESRETWIASYKRLLSLIQVPTVLLWLSIREPHYVEKYDSIHNLFGEFPHLVNDSMVEDIRSDCTAYVECVSARGRPQQLKSRFTGRPTRVLVPGEVPMTENSYYPTPEMHEDAAALLVPICQEIVDGCREA